jgi:signal transduction histidine kinase
VSRSAEQPTDQSPFRRAAGGAAAAAGAALVIAALIFSNSFAAQQVAEDALILDSAEATLGANDIAVKSLGQAILLAEDELLGVADAATSEAALTEARFSISELRERATALMNKIGSEADLNEAAAMAIDGADEVVALLERGDVAAAGALLAGPGRVNFETFRDLTRVRRDGAADSVTDATDLMSRVANLAAFVIAFLIPATAILAYRRIARNQLRLAEVQLDARLDAERDLVKAKDEFVASISHELRTPLTSIYGFSELLIEEGLVDPEYSMELITMINDQSAELHRMVEDLLTSARHEAGTISLAPRLIDLTSELAVEVRHVTGREVAFDVAGVAWCDAGRLQQIIRNLLANAERYGGDEVRVATQQRGDFTEIVVSDNGPGVPADKAVRLFTRYVHEGEDPLTVGSIGLGLAVVRILAEVMGGSARYERAEGWSRFIIALPASEAAADAAWQTNQAVGSLAPHIAAARRTPVSDPYAEGITDEVA